MATDGLQRIGVRLTAEGAEDFRAELANVTAAARENEAQFKLLKAQYDENTTAAQKYADRVSHAESAVAIYSDKCKILATQLREMQENENADATAIAKKRAELARAQTTVAKYQKELSAAQKALAGESKEAQAARAAQEALRKEQEALGKSLQVTDAKLQQANARLKQHEGLYSGATTAAQKLRDQQDYAAEAVGLYGDKLETLSRQLEILEQAEEQDQTAIEKKRAEIEKVRAELVKYQKQLEDTTRQLGNHSAALQEWGKKLQAAGKTMQNVGKTLTTHVTAPIVAVGAAAYSAWQEVDEATDNLAKTTGATGEDLKALEAQYQHLASTIPTSLEDAAAAVGEVNTRLDLSGEAAGQAAEQILKFAAVTGSDVTAATDGAQKAMAAWSLSAETLPGVLDVAAKAAQETGTGVDNLFSLLASNSATLRDVGLGFSDAAMFLANLDKNGIDASAAMTGLKKAFVEGAETGRSTQEVLQALQETMLAAGSSAEANAAAMELFGAKAGPQLADAILSGRLSFDSMGASMESFAGTVSGTFEETLDPADRLQSKMNELKVAGAEVAESGMDVLVPVLEQLADVLKSAAEWFNGLSEGQQEAVIKMGLFAAAAGPVTSAVGGITSGIGGAVSAGGKLIDWIGRLSSAAPAASTALSTLSGASGIGGLVGSITGGGGLIASLAPLAAAAAPFLVGGAIVAGIGLGVYEIIKHWDQIKEWAGNAKEAIVNGWNGITEGISTALEPAKEYVDEKLSGIEEAFQEHGGGLSGVLAGGLEAVRASYEVGLDGLDALTGGHLKGLTDSWRENLDENAGLIQDHLDGMKDAYEEAGGGVKGIIAAYGEHWRDTFRVGYDKIDKLTGGRLGDFYDKVEEKFKAVQEFIRKAIDKIKEFFDFDWELPEIKLPHFNIDGGFSLNPPSAPKFSIDWYKKAMSSPRLLSGATIFGASGDSLLGGGEAGDEVVYGRSSLMRDISEAAGGGEQLRLLQRIAGALEERTPVVININGMTQKDSKALAQEVGRLLYSENAARKAAMGW